MNKMHVMHSTTHRPRPSMDHVCHGMAATAPHLAAATELGVAPGQWRLAALTRIGERTNLWQRGHAADAPRSFSSPSKSLPPLGLGPFPQRAMQPWRRRKIRQGVHMHDAACASESASYRSANEVRGDLARAARKKSLFLCMQRL
ncbi:hypothetical protein VFPBJ_06732 [Purpureocillium lilacinum]|uniref:Uncharacterized protein n=1 Tax=Purpureocillium lilacinum TaxID=33203 RepID=A0A179GMP7_PURLI|nr:hypothetical protein VFPBJ_06732 [Purpureocillium lilacinum]